MTHTTPHTTDSPSVLYSRPGPGWPWRLGVFVAALCFSGLTALLIPLSDLLTPRPDHVVEYRTVDVTEWRRPPPPPPPRPPPPPKPPPPTPPPEPTPPAPTPVPTEAPPPKLKLPVKLDFALSDFKTDVALDFEVDPDVEVLPAATLVPLRPPPPPPPPPPPKRPELDRQPTVLSQVKPIYPYRARSRRIEGHVDLEFTVTAAGTVELVSAVDARPRGVFERAAVAAVSRWRFSPGTRDGHPVDARMQIRIRFTLDQ